MSQPVPPDDAGTPAKTGLRFGWILALGFVALAIVLLVLPSEAPVPLAPPVIIDRVALNPGPRRSAKTDPATIVVEGAMQNCNACHQIFNLNPSRTSVSAFHKNIHLSHGLNNRCFNCHDSNNLERLTLRDGSTVSYSQTPMLCAQCHGTVYRDWERGTHGKTMGSWQTGSPAQQRMTCNQCHDPHAPKYEPYAPMPGPRTLRMGEQESRHELEGKRSPLQQWLTQQDGHGATVGNIPQHGERP